MAGKKSHPSNKEINSGNSRKPYWKGKKISATSGSGSGSGSKQAIKRELKFYIHDSLIQKNGCTYRKVEVAIVFKVQATFNNGNQSIRSKTNSVFKQPELGELPKSGDEKIREQKMLDRKWDVDYKRYVEKGEEFTNNWVKPYALMFESYCARELQIPLKELLEFEIRVRDQPLDLLMVVENLVHTPMCARYPTLTLVETLSSLITNRRA